MFERGFFVVLISALLVASHAGADARVLVESSEVVITQEQFEEALQALAPDGDEGDMFSNERRAREFLIDYFTLQVMAGRAREAGLHKDRWVQARLRYNEDRFLAQAYREKAIAEMEEPDFEQMAREEYLARPDQHMVPEQVRAQHILIKVDGNRNREQALELATEVRNQLDHGADFEKLVAEYSNDEVANTRGGDLGFFTRDRMVKPFADAAFAMTETGELTGPIETKFGFHIIRLQDRRPAYRRDFEEVREQLAEQARTKFRGEAARTLTRSIRSDETIKTHHENVNALFGRSVTITE